MRLISIDPGKKGAISIFEIDSFANKVTLREIIDTPILGKEYNYREVYNAVSRLGKVDKAILESTLCLASSGTDTAKQVGIGQGMWSMLFTVLEIPYEFIPPTKWTSELKLPKSKGLTSKQNKENHVALACRLYPSFSIQFYGPKGGLLDGRADSVLIGDAWIKINLKTNRGELAA
jgi:hypothetical protein